MTQTSCSKNVSAAPAAGSRASNRVVLTALLPERLPGSRAVSQTMRPLYGARRCSSPDALPLVRATCSSLRPRWRLGRAAGERMTRDREELIADALGRIPSTIVENEDGWDFRVAIVDDEWVFRFPRRSGVEEALEVEIAVLPALADA